LKELIALLRAKPGELNFASTNGNASSSHIAGELFKKMAKVDMVHVPFKGDAVAAPAVLAGDVQMMFSLTAGVTAISARVNFAPLPSDRSNVRRHYPRCQPSMKQDCRALPPQAGSPF